MHILHVHTWRNSASQDQTMIAYATVGLPDDETPESCLLQMVPPREASFTLFLWLRWSPGMFQTSHRQLGRSPRAGRETEQVPAVGHCMCWCNYIFVWV